jgi:uncharacterized membrane protein
VPDLVVLFVLAWMTIGTGALFYFRPLSIAAKRMRVVVFVAVCGSAVTLSLHSGIPNTSGRAVFAIGLPIGHDLILPYLYGYLFYKLFPIFGFGLLITATIGPIIYLLKTRRDSARR